MSPSKGSGSDFYLTQAARVSKRFANVLVESTLEGCILYRDALRMLAISWRRSDSASRSGSAPAVTCRRFSGARMEKGSMVTKEARIARRCLREPIPEIEVAANYFADSVTAHLEGKSNRAIELIRLADMQIIREWTESVWGRNSLHVLPVILEATNDEHPLTQRVKARMPGATEKRQLHLRDGYRCRFCGIPVIRKEIRMRIRACYPEALNWGRTNSTQHAAFQAMWAQYDHVLPHARGGDNVLENLVVSCAPCNFGRMSYTLKQVALLDPRSRDPIRSSWDGLERFSPAAAGYGRI